MACAAARRAPWHRAQNSSVKGFVPIEPPLFAIRSRCLKRNFRKRFRRV
jgi:hypothetical protein